MVASHKYLVRVWEFYEPVEEVKHLFLRSIVCKVAAMHYDISRRKPFQLLVAAVRVGYL